MAPSSISQEKKIRKFPSAGNVMITVFRDCEGVMPREERNNSNAYTRTMTEYTKLFKPVWSHKSPTEILLQLENARLHTSLKSHEAITKFCWTMLHDPPHRPDLALWDIHLFGAMKDAIRSTKLGTDDVRTWEPGNESRARYGHDKAYIHLFLINKGHKSGQRLCGKTGYGVTPSLFIMCNFHYLEINIYWQTIRDIVFWASLIHSTYFKDKARQ
jgi:hypothetical protein